MQFNNHLDLAGKHAFLSGSKHSWINYTPEKLASVYANHRKKEEGTILHSFAELAIKKRIKLAKHKKALNQFVNDAIGFNMHPEVVLHYSDNAFGTADAILFKDGLLRIHDLKTGVSKVSFKQLDIYAALFCLEYSVDPEKIDIEERIYQGREILVDSPLPSDIQFIMDKIVEFDVIIDKVKLEL